MKKLVSFLNKNPEIIFFICAFISWTALMCYENAKEGSDFRWHDLKVEANGMIFDLFVFGILVTTYNAIRARKEKIERLKEEIDDYRDWNEPEAVYRTVGALRRLITLEAKRSEISLHNCYLNGAQLKKIDISGIKLKAANLKKAELVMANLRKTDMSFAILSEACLKGADLEGANLWGANLEGVQLEEYEQNYFDRESDCWDVVFTKTNLSGVNLQAAKVSTPDWIDLLKKWDVKGYEEIANKYVVDENLCLRLKSDTSSSLYQFHA